MRDSIDRVFSSALPGIEIMTPAEAAACHAPFPDASHKAALRAFPNLVPDGQRAPGAALNRTALQRFGLA